MKSVQIINEEYPSVSSLYNDIQKAFVAATSNPDILPNLEYLNPKFRFSK